MKLKARNVVISAGLCMLAILLFGCTFFRTDLVKNGTVILDVEPSEDEYISWAYAEHYDNEMEIGGLVKSSLSLHMLEGGHVDIDIIAPDGAPIKQCVVYFPPAPRKETHTWYFYAHFQLYPVHGTKVHLIYHHTTSPEELLSPCD